MLPLVSRAMTMSMRVTLFTGLMCRAWGSFGDGGVLWECLRHADAGGAANNRAQVITTRERLMAASSLFQFEVVGFFVAD